MVKEEKKTFEVIRGNTDIVLIKMVEKIVLQQQEIIKLLEEIRDGKQS